MHSAAQHQRGCSAGLRPAPAPSQGNSRSTSNSWLSVGRRGGSGCGRRRKPVLGGLAAASMPRTLPQPDPPRLRRFLAICCRSTPCVDESLSDNEINRGQIRFPKENGSDPMPSAMPFPRTIQPSPGNCRRRGGVGLRGVRGMDAAAKPPWTGLRRPRNPTPPRQTTDSPEPLWLWLRAGAGRSPVGPPSPAHENDFTDFSKPSSLRHASTILRSSMRPRATHAKNRPPIA